MNGDKLRVSRYRYRTQYSEGIQPLEEYRENHAEMGNVRRLKLQEEGFHVEGH